MVPAVLTMIASILWGTIMRTLIGYKNRVDAAVNMAGCVAGLDRFTRFVAGYGVEYVEYCAR